MNREYEFESFDPLALARELDIHLPDTAFRLSVKTDWARRLAHDYHHAARVKRAALEIGLRAIWSFASDARSDPSLRAKAKGNIEAIRIALEDLETPLTGS